MYSNTMMTDIFRITNKFEMTPFKINDEEGFCGVQLILGNDSQDENENSKFQVVTVMDSKNINNIYQYRSKMTVVGSQKFYSS